jgi:hypothetical protein
MMGSGVAVNAYSFVLKKQYEVSSHRLFARRVLEEEDMVLVNLCRIWTVLFRLLAALVRQ